MARRTNKTTASGEYRFKIDAYTLETMPMARLAEYIAELAKMLGEAKSVHLVALEEGSTVLVHRVEREAIPKVLDRAKAVRRGDAPREALIAYRAVNRLLRDDNASGVLVTKKKGPTILKFPGRQHTQDLLQSVREHGTIDGIIMRVGGTDETVPVLLESEGEQVAGCFTTRRIAKQLAHRLFERVRLSGRGLWSRDDVGVWTLKTFRIESFEPLDDTPLSEALEEVRAVDAEWPTDTYDELARIRHGRLKKHGGR
jgi:hypothetical protein